MAVIKFGPKIKSKSKNKGMTVMYLGKSIDHGPDVHRFFSLATKKVVESRDVMAWLNKVYGDWKGLAKPGPEGVITVTKPDPGPDTVKEETKSDPVVVKKQEPGGGRAPFMEPLPRMTRELKGLQSDFLGDSGDVVTRLRNLQSGRERGDLAPIVETVEENEDTPSSNEAASPMIERLFDDFVPEFAFMASDWKKKKHYTIDELNRMPPELRKDLLEKPTTFEEAYNHPCPWQREHWRKAIQSEFLSMKQNVVWRKMLRANMPKGRRCVKCKWVFEWKRDGRARARLVACGYTQVAGLDFELIYAPVVNDVTFRICLVVKMVWGLASILFDVATAFLHGDLEGVEIFMECPEGMEHSDDECLQLLKTIYGTVQAARAFNDYFCKIMRKIGFTQSRSDPCLFIRRNEKGLAIVILYVDDGAAFGHPAALKALVVELQEEGLTLTVQNNMNDYLSCQIVYDKHEKKAWLGQPHMIKKIEKEFGDLVAKKQTYKTPGTPGFHVVRAKPDDAVIDPSRQSKFRTGVGMLLFLVKHSRPDIANATRELAKCMDKALEAGWKELLRVIKFVIDTKAKGLKMFPIKCDGDLWIVEVYSDTDWAGDKDDRKSISGYIIFLYGVPIMWRSKGQKTVALSSSEAEFVGASEAVKEVLFVVQILADLGAPVKLPVPVYVDNMGAIFMVENDSSGGRTRHVDTRWNFIKDFNRKGLVNVKFVESKKNKSDGFTKNVMGEIYEAHADSFVIDKADLENADT